jgi:hypothetical protein
MLLSSHFLSRLLRLLLGLLKAAVTSRVLAAYCLFKLLARLYKRAWGPQTVSLAKRNVLITVRTDFVIGRVFTVDAYA